MKLLNIFVDPFGCCKIQSNREIDPQTGKQLQTDQVKSEKALIVP